MFETLSTPRVFFLPPGVDFAAEVARGLRARFVGSRPEAIARVEVIVNTARMKTHLTQALMAEGPGFLPRIRLIASLAAPAPDTGVRTRLEMAQALRRLLLSQPDLGPTSAAFSLAESLFAMLDEMQAEGVTLETIEKLDVSNHSKHWERSLQVIHAVAAYMESPKGGQTALRAAVDALAREWGVKPPAHPIIVAGSTGSRGPSFDLLRAVARLPQGAVILPGFDSDMPADLWSGMRDPLLHEDHPQFRLARLLRALDLDLTQVAPWTAARPPAPARNRLISLALRPAPVTDQWLIDGQGLGNLVDATRDLSLIEAVDERTEAQAIALAMRDAAAEGQKAALITPDRALARRVSAALGRWGIVPDDSAGAPLSLSAPGRLLRQIAQVMTEGPASPDMIALLKHPLAHPQEARGPHLLAVRRLDLFLRKGAAPRLDAAVLTAFADKNPDLAPWVDWLEQVLGLLAQPARLSLTAWCAQLRTAAQTLAAGALPQTEAGALWDKDAGIATLALVERLEAEAAHGGDLTGADFRALLDTLFAGQEVRADVETDSRFAIWGTLEARAQTADLVILAGLNDGTWPAALSPDPWFNRAMRVNAGLLLPERQIGLSAHDFQQAIAAPSVILSRALRSGDAETVASRWLNRILNLVRGLPDLGGPEALAAMSARGDDLLRRAARIDADPAGLSPELSRRNPRPAPAPPREKRLKSLRVTEIEKLTRDPYTVYARRILGLESLDALGPEGDPRIRGIILHKIVETYVRDHPPRSPADPAALVAIGARLLDQECPWPALRVHWLAQLEALASDFCAWNEAQDSEPVVQESGGALTLHGGFVLRGRPDRIDRRPDGSLVILDYKTGSPPSKKQQKHFAKQLPLLAIMAEDGAFPEIQGHVVGQTGYVRMGSGFAVDQYTLEPDTLPTHRRELQALIAAYDQENQGFVALRAPETDRQRRIDPYNTLARMGEWEPSDPPETLPVGDRDG